MPATINRNLSYTQKYAPRVLIVEDSKLRGNRLKAHLREAKWRVKAASNAEEAVKQMQRFPADVVIVDIATESETAGMDTAQQIQTAEPDVPIIFLTAYDTPQNRAKATQRGLHPDQWIEKTPEWLTVTSRALSEAVIRRRWGELAQLLVMLRSQLAPLTQHRLEALLEEWEVDEQAKPERERVSTLEPETVLSEMGYQLDDIEQGYDDPAYRLAAWERFQQYAAQHLWQAHEKLSEDRNRLQLVDQLETAIRRMEWFQLQHTHLTALRLSLERLASKVVRSEDIDACEIAWRKAKVATLPSFAEVLNDWQELYRVGEADEEE